MVSARYLMTRIGQAVFTIFASVTISFALVRLIPGGPIDYMVARLQQQAAAQGERIDPEVAREIANKLLVVPNEPLWKQYIDYVSSILFEGDFGVSIWYDEPVVELLGNALPWTVFLLTMGLFMSYGLGLLLGGLMAYWEGGKFDGTMTLTNIFSTSVPYYVFALFLLGTFGYTLGWFPTGGRMNPNTTPGFNLPFIAGALMHAFLPFLSLQIAGFGGPALAMRGNSISVLGSDYMRVAELRGLQTHTIAVDYVIRNAVLPLYTGFMIGIASVFSGSVILETIFSYRGVGFFIVEAFSRRDYPIMMGGFIMLTIITIAGVFVADLTYGFIDPRVDAEEGQ